jgi:hypothetical protein
MTFWRMVELSLAKALLKGPWIRLQTTQFGSSFSDLL